MPRQESRKRNQQWGYHLAWGLACVLGSACGPADPVLPMLHSDKTVTTGTWPPVPPVEQSRTCAMLPFETLSRVLASRGVDVANTTTASAGALFAAARIEQPALDAGPGFAAVRVEPLRAMRLFDIFLAAAEQIIPNLSTTSTCLVDGMRPPLFLGNRCTEPGLSCLLGIPTTPELVQACSDILQRAPDSVTGQRFAVATLLSTHLLCE